jgi:SagB-type dehydrogenase family enzyme
MKRLILFFTVLIVTANMHAQELSVIKLSEPNKSGGTPVMKVFNDRHSDREYASTPIRPQDLSDLLWAANGINRSDGKRTAPSARNVQDVDVYVILPKGAYFYEAKTHSLNPVSAGDHRNAVASGQDFAATAPMCIVLVTELARLGDASAERTKLMGAVDIGIVSQNINMVCAALGLSTVPRATMDHTALKKVLKLTDTQMAIMNNPVGYPK